MDIMMKIILIIFFIMGILFLGTLIYLVYKFLFKPVIKGYKELKNNERLKNDFKDLEIVEKINFCNEIYNNIVQPREAKEKLLKKEQLEKLINKMK